MPPVAIIDQKMADRFWPGGDAIGKRIRPSDDSPWVTIVGVVGVVKEYGLDTDTRMVVYWPHAKGQSEACMSSHVPHLDPASTSAAIIHLVNAINPDVPVYDIATRNSVSGIPWRVSALP